MQPLRSRFSVHNSAQRSVEYSVEALEEVSLFTVIQVATRSYLRPTTLRITVWFPESLLASSHFKNKICRVPAILKMSERLAQ